MPTLMSSAVRRTILTSRGTSAVVTRNIGPAIDTAAMQDPSCPNTGAPMLTTPRSFSSTLTT